MFLLTISYLKRVGDLQAPSVAPSCLDFAPGMVNAFQNLRLGYGSKVPTAHSASGILSCHSYCIPVSACFDLPEANTVHTSVFKPACHYVTPAMTPHYSVGLISHVLQDAVHTDAFPKYF